MNTKATVAPAGVQFLKLVGIDTYANPRLSPLPMLHGQVARVTDAQADMMHAASAVIDGDDENTWFQEVADTTKFDHDFTPPEMQAEAADQEVTAVVVTTVKRAGARKGVVQRPARRTPTK